MPFESDLVKPSQSITKDVASGGSSKDDIRDVNAMRYAFISTDLGGNRKD